MVVATKLGSKAVGDGPNQKGLSRAWMIDGLNGSLKRLGTDYVDIYYLHRADPTTPLAETIETMGELIRSGKVRYWGFSNFRAWKIAEMVHLAKELGVPKPVIAQPFYSAVYRVPEFEYLPACHEYGIGVVPYSPLARGVLTGKYGMDIGSAKDTKRGAGEVDTYADVYTRDCLRIAAKIKARAEKARHDGRRHVDQLAAQQQYRQFDRCGTAHTRALESLRRRVGSRVHGCRRGVFREAGADVLSARYRLHRTERPAARPLSGRRLIVRSGAS